MDDKKFNKARMDGPMSYDHFSELTPEDDIEAERALREYVKNRGKASNRSVQ